MKGSSQGNESEDMGVAVKSGECTFALTSALSNDELLKPAGVIFMFLIMNGPI